MMDTSYQQLWQNRKLYLTAMTHSGAKLFAAAFRSIRIEALEFPPPTRRGWNSPRNTFPETSVFLLRSPWEIF
ncbi:MAG: hypothetical protein ACHQKY_02665 [Terriglobia bacterium]